MQTVDEALQDMQALLACQLCGGQLRATVTIQECGHHFCHTCVYSSLGSTCRCPTCNLPARVGNLLKNPTYDILVACSSKLLELRRGVSPTIEDEDFSSSIRNRHQSQRVEAFEEEQLGSMHTHRHNGSMERSEGTPLGSVIWAMDCGPTFTHSEPMDSIPSSLSAGASTSAKSLNSPPDQDSSPVSASIRSSNTDNSTLPSLNTALLTHGTEKALQELRDRANAARTVLGPASLFSPQDQTLPSLNTVLKNHGKDKNQTATAISSTPANATPDNANRTPPTPVLHGSTDATRSRGSISDESRMPPPEVPNTLVTAQASSKIPEIPPSSSLSSPSSVVDPVAGPKVKPTMSQLQRLLNINHERLESCIPSSQENETQTLTQAFSFRSQEGEDDPRSYHSPHMPSQTYFTFPLSQSETEDGSSLLSRKRAICSDRDKPTLVIQEEQDQQSEPEDGKDLDTTKPRKRSVDRARSADSQEPFEVQSSQPTADMIAPSLQY